MHAVAWAERLILDIGQVTAEQRMKSMQRPAALCLLEIDIVIYRWEVAFFLLMINWSWWSTIACGTMIDCTSLWGEDARRSMINCMKLPKHSHWGNKRKWPLWKQSKANGKLYAYWEDDAACEMGDQWTVHHLGWYYCLLDGHHHHGENFKDLGMHVMFQPLIICAVCRAVYSIHESMHIHACPLPALLLVEATSGKTLQYITFIGQVTWKFLGATAVPSSLKVQYIQV